MPRMQRIRVLTLHAAGDKVQLLLHRLLIAAEAAFITLKVVNMMRSFAHFPTVGSVSPHLSYKLAGLTIAAHACR